MALPFDPVEIRLRVGLEVHQQLASRNKLFCGCPITKSGELPYEFERRLRPAQSEFGRVDPAVAFEFARSKPNVYRWNPESSCLVDADEEPPHPLNDEALDTAVLVARLLGSNVVDEVHVMRKMVIDGSNTGGFQRTAVVALGGRLEVGGTSVGVQTVTIEEDASRILGEDDAARYFALDRLGVPLVEVALDTVTGPPELVERVALSLGRALRSTGRVARGLGTIRQDLNVSVMGGSVVEVKGVQKLGLLQKVVVYEALRQMSLLEVAAELKRRGVKDPSCQVKDVSRLASGLGSRVVHRQLEEGGKVVCVSAEGFAGLLGHEPHPGFRLGKELAEVARANSLGGVIHSDEFERQGVKAADRESLLEEMGAGEGAALILVAGPPARVDSAVTMLTERLKKAVDGVPAETRAATPDGETRFLRPRPGAQRMYPETDIPEIVITGARLKAVSALVPVPWEKQVRSLEERYSLSSELAQRVYDYQLAGEFSELAGSLTRTPPSVVAWALVELPASVAREVGAEEEEILPICVQVLRAIDGGLVAKEAAFDVAKTVARGDANDVGQAIEALGIRPLTESELVRLVDSVVKDGGDLISQRGGAAFAALMGEVMKRARGRVDGGTVSRVLRERLDRALER